MMMMIPKRYALAILPPVLTKHIDIKFNPTHEDNGQINFLTLRLIQKPPKIETDLFQEPTNTDMTINYRT
jgi:hypothetical protein